MQNYKVGNQVHVLDDPKFEYKLPAGAVKITQTQANKLSEPPAKTAAEKNEEKDLRVEAELGSDAIRILIETIVQTIQDGSITTSSAVEILALAKANRRNEL